MSRMIKNKPISLLNDACCACFASNKLYLDCILCENEFEEKINGMSHNVFLFLLSGTLSLTIDGSRKHTFDDNEIIFIPRYSSCHLSVTRHTKFVTASFREIKDRYGLTLIKLIKAEYPVVPSVFPCLPINPVLQEYIGEVCRFLANPMNEHQKCEILEEEFFMVLGVYYTKRELARLFSPILINPQLIR